MKKRIISLLIAIITIFSVMIFDAPIVEAKTIPGGFKAVKYGDGLGIYNFYGTLYEYGDKIVRIPSYSSPSRTDEKIVALICFKGSHGVFEDSDAKVVKIPNTVTTIGNYALSNCDTLRTIYLPTSLENVEPKAFSGAIFDKVYYGGTREQWEAHNFDSLIE